MDGFHCGEYLEVIVGSEWVETAMEMAWKDTWYLVGTPYRGDNLEGVQTRIK